MATQMISQAGGSSLFCNSGNFGISDMYGLHDLSKAEVAAPRLIMLANVALTGEVSSGCCDYVLEEDRQMAELTTVYENSFSDSDGERMEIEEENMGSESGIFETSNHETPDVQSKNLCENQITPKDDILKEEPVKKLDSPCATEDKSKCAKSKPFRCRPCQYKAESEEEFVHHIKDHSAKRLIDHDTNKNVQESGSPLPEEVDFSKGPIRCDRCGYNTNRFDHYLAHLKHHNKAVENERVYKCTICTYTTVSEYHWKKHLRNHFPRIVYTCSQCSYFSDRKNNYIQHIRTHTGERPYQCVMCPYSSSQKTHLTRHMRTHSGEKPFKCEQCSYVASNQHEVTRHARQVHNGPKPLTCPHCNYKTADRSNFKKHVELHVNPRQFLCPVCDYAASKKCNLQYHIKSRHSGCADITMDVSKVKLRTKKGEATVLELDSNKQEEKENSEIKTSSAEKNLDGQLKADKEKCVKIKCVASPSIGQVTTRSRKPSSQKTENKDTDKSTLKARCAKRKYSAAECEKPLKTDTQNTNVKKSKLSHTNQRVDNVPRKRIRSGKSLKQKVCLKNNQKKHVKNKYRKKTITHKTEMAKRKSTIATEQNDEKNSLQDQPETNNVSIKASCAESTPEPSNDQNPATEIVETEENKENRGDLSVASPIPNLPFSEKTNCSYELILEKEADVNDSDNEYTDHVLMSTCTDEPEQNFLAAEPLNKDVQADASNTNTSDSCDMQSSPSEPASEDYFKTNKAEVNDEQPEPNKVNDPEELHSMYCITDVNNDDPKDNAHPQCGISSNEPLDIEEDEGIHSHEGSDISDNISERSDDSVLNGLQSAQESIEPKHNELPSVEARLSTESFVCIFCDRAFRKVEEYTKHLKRHLVNVYYLEKAAKDRP